MVFLSLSARLLINIEALNMVESVGNVTRHRRATVIIETPEGYRKIEVPAISGETIAHGYQEALVEVAKVIYNGKPPVCKWCMRGEFFKEMDTAHIIDEAKKVEGEKEVYAHNFEKIVVNKCLVEDIGGFLKAEKPPVRRTSRFYTGYMVPVKDAIKVSNIESQFHARHAPSEPSRREGERAAQMIYYVEVGSAIYGFMFNLDIENIGCTSLVKRELAISHEERNKRIKVALGALLNLLSGRGFGAKLTRFLPIIEVKSFALAISDPMPFTVMPPSTTGFINETVSKKNMFKGAYAKIGIEETVKIFANSKETKLPKDEDLIIVSSIEEAVERATEYVFKLKTRAGA